MDLRNFLIRLDEEINEAANPDMPKFKNLENGSWSKDYPKILDVIVKFGKNNPDLKADVFTKKVLDKLDQMGPRFSVGADDLDYMNPYYVEGFGEEDDYDEEELEDMWFDYVEDQKNKGVSLYDMYKKNHVSKEFARYAKGKSKQELNILDKFFKEV